MYPDKLIPINHVISKAFEEWCWNDFSSKKSNKEKEFK